MLEDVGCALSFSTVTNCHTKLDAIAPTKDFQESFHPEQEKLMQVHKLLGPIMS
jgi:hypothetical protein